MSSEESLLNYLKNTFSIREINETFDPLNPDESGSQRSVLAPWSLEAIKVNTGLSYSEIEKTISSIKFLSLDKVEANGFQTILIRTNRELEGTSEFVTLPEIKELSISKLMNLHVLQFVQNKINETDHPVKIEDAIFDLKNTLFLPDDFMPEHLMGMVEGTVDLSDDQLRSAYSVIGDAIPLLFYKEAKDDGTGRIRFLYPAKSVKLVGVPSNERIREIISSSFESIKNLKSYIYFINSRLIKTLIFNIQQKNLRELKRPVFNPVNIKFLQEFGIVEEKAGISLVKEDITLEKLKELYSDLKGEGEKLAKSWLSRSVEVK